ncbi:MAG: N-acetylmuramoyl-L-alanine amidase [Methylacidiphilales bacterium]|nr:N-acetylmuramoyl-L-alanine amidase [Candidatus Methylacidiphilales bacterium]
MAFFFLGLALPVRAFDWETATSNGRQYVTLRSFCEFYHFHYEVPSGDGRFVSRNESHSLMLKLGASDMYLDGIHYVMSFPIEGGDSDWLVSRMDVIKLFDPILRPDEISDRHPIRGVVIDAGHGGSDNGATSRLGNEKTYTLDTAYRLDAILRAAGLRTVFTRRTDVFVDLYERAHIASLYSDYCFVSIHFNSATEEARGLETYCLSPRGAASTSSSYLTRGDIQELPGNEYDTQNILLASMVHSEIIKLNPGDATADRGVKRARFVVIKQNVLPAILVEGGFVSNHMEAARVNRPDYRQSLAQAIARGVIRFVNVMGDRHLQMPGNPAPAPKPIAVVPPAPSGLAHDPANGNFKQADAPSSSHSSAASTTTASHKTKKNKNKKTVAAQAPAHPPQPAPAPAAAVSTTTAETTAKTPATTPAGSLNLSEPAVPAPSPGADKAPAEPDEPPTVNADPSASTTPSSGTTSGTNANSSPAPPRDP